MLFTTTLLAAVSLLAQAEGSVIDRRQDQIRANNAGTGNGGAAATCLAANAVQSGSASTGQQNGVAADGQVNSKTDTANFINFCEGKTLTNGVQVKTGSCNGIVMGDIPATTNMASTIILSPVSGKAVEADTTFNVTVQIANMALGSFTNATSTYYSAPQQLSGGNVIGHTHVTIQDLGTSQTPQTPPDASKFVFFKGINDAGNGAGKLTTAVTNGLPAGNYRVCTMAGSSNHQPLLMPVAQRGAQDDCIRIVVSGGNGEGAAGGAAGGSGTGNAAASSSKSSAASKATGKGSAGEAGTGNAAASSSKSAAASKATGKGSAGDAGTGNAAASSSKTSATTSSSADKGGKGGKGKASTTREASSAATSVKATGKGKASASTSANKIATTSTSAAAAASKTGSSDSTTNNAATGTGVAAGSAIAGIAAPSVQDSGDSSRPFLVQGNSFVNKGAAVQRACAIQNNACANAVNSGKAAGSTVGDCNQQEDTCNAAGGA